SATTTERPPQPPAQQHVHPPPKPYTHRKPTEEALPHPNGTNGPSPPTRGEKRRPRSSPTLLTGHPDLHLHHRRTGHTPNRRMPPQRRRKNCPHRLPAEKAFHQQSPYAKQSDHP